MSAAHNDKSQAFSNRDMYVMLTMGATLSKTWRIEYTTSPWLPPWAWWTHVWCQLPLRRKEQLFSWQVNAGWGKAGRQSAWFRSSKWASCTPARYRKAMPRCMFSPPLVPLSPCSMHITVGEFGIRGPKLVWKQEGATVSLLKTIMTLESIFESILG